MSVLSRLKQKSYFLRTNSTCAQKNWPHPTWNAQVTSDFQWLLFVFHK